MTRFLISCILFVYVNFSSDASHAGPFFRGRCTEIATKSNTGERSPGWAHIFVHSNFSSRADFIALTRHVRTNSRTTLAALFRLEIPKSWIPKFSGPKDPCSVRSSLRFLHLPSPWKSLPLADPLRPTAVPIIPTALRLLPHCPLRQKCPVSGRTPVREGAQRERVPGSPSARSDMNQI